MILYKKLKLEILEKFLMTKIQNMTIIYKNHQKKFLINLIVFPDPRIKMKTIYKLFKKKMNKRALFVWIIFLMQFIWTVDTEVNIFN